MKTIKSLSVLLIPILVLTSIAPISVAYATPPTPAIGSFTEVSTVITDLRYAGGNEIVSYTVTYAITGTIEGIMVVHGTSVKGLTTGKGMLQALATIFGTVDGVAGTMVLRLTGKIDGYIFEEGRWVVLSGTNGLENLHGQGIWSDTVFVGGTYSGQIH